MTTLVDQVMAARSVSTPLIAISTPDQPAVLMDLRTKLNGSIPLLSWDRSRGIQWLNEKGRSASSLAAVAFGLSEPFEKSIPIATVNPADAMRFIWYLPGATKKDPSLGCVVIAQSMDRSFRDPSCAAETIQAILNLRESFKENLRTLIMLAPSFTLPPELQHDVILLEDPLPTREAFVSIVKDVHDSAGLDEPTKEQTDKSILAVRGLSAFEAEQVLAMSVALAPKQDRIDLPSAWALKKAAVSKTEGLTMTLEGPDLSDLKGLDAIIRMLDGLWKGPKPPEVVMRVDEIDKGLAGLGSRGGPGDNTGVSQDLHQQFLVNMEDNGWIGAILVGIRGSGKTILTQSIGAAHGVPTIAMDPGKMKKPHVGESEQAFREAFRTVKAIGESNVLVLATCNRLDVIPPELMRRFKLGIWYFDLPSVEERDALWPIYLKKYGHPLDSERPNDTDWTGSEIRNACEIAYLLSITPKEAGELYVVPITKSDQQSVQDLRKQAQNRFFSASRGGTYNPQMEEERKAEPSGRRFSMRKER